MLYVRTRFVFRTIKFLMVATRNPDIQFLSSCRLISLEPESFAVMY